MIDSNNKSLPLVSVIIPSFNRPDLLAEALNSVLSQTYEHYEIIIVNDAGVDVEDVISLLNKDEKIVYLKHKKNMGLPAARNTGIRAAKGKYISYLDDDDIYYSQHLEILVKHLENSDCKVAYTNSYHVDQCFIKDRYVTTRKTLRYNFDFDRNKLLVENYIPIINVMHSNSIIKKSGLFDESLSVYEDWDLLIRLSQLSDFSHINKITAEVHIRDDTSNMTAGNYSSFLRTMRSIHAKYANLVYEKRVFDEQQKAIRALERLVEHQKGFSTVIQSSDFHNYTFVRDIFRNKSVLDLKCGEGHGCFMAAQVAKKVIGFESNSEQIIKACSQYVKENLFFVRSSANNMPIKPELKFDVVIYFSEIGLIENPEATVKQIKNIMSDDGIFITSISNYNRNIKVKGLRCDHDNLSSEIIGKQMDNIINKYFKNLLFFGHGVFPVSSIFPLLHSPNGICESVLEKKDVGFVSDVKRPIGIDDLIIIASDDHVDCLDNKRHDLDVSEVLIREKKLEMKNFEVRIENLKGHIAILYQDLIKKDEELIRRDEMIRERDRYIERKEIDLNSMKQSKVWRMADFLRHCFYGRLRGKQ